MKTFLAIVLMAVCLSCNDAKDHGKADRGTSELPASAPGANASTKEKEDFLLTCHVDASNSLDGKSSETVTAFCECAWEKTKGEYHGEIIATESKLKKDPSLKDCYEEAMKK